MLLMPHESKHASLPLPALPFVLLLLVVLRVEGTQAHSYTLACLLVSSAAAVMHNMLMLF